MNVRNVKVKSLYFLLGLALGWTLSVKRNESDCTQINANQVVYKKNNFLKGYLEFFESLFGNSTL